VYSLSEKKVRKIKASVKVSEKEGKKIPTMLHAALEITSKPLGHETINPYQDTSDSTILKSSKIHATDDDGRCDYEEIAPPPRNVYIDERKHSGIKDNSCIEDTSQLNLTSTQNSSLHISTLPEVTSLLCSPSDEDSDLSRFLSSILKCPVYNDTQLSAQRNINLNPISANSSWENFIYSETTSHSARVGPLHWLTSDSPVSLPPLVTTRCPSVSLILRETMSEENRFVLERWEKRMIQELGQEGFNKFKQGWFLIVVHKYC